MNEHIEWIRRWRQAKLEWIDYSFSQIVRDVIRKDDLAHPPKPPPRSEVGNFGSCYTTTHTAPVWCFGTSEAVTYGVHFVGNGGAGASGTTSVTSILMTAGGRP
jgi:hypothetical protein